jgi:hypothetical protein
MEVFQFSQMCENSASFAPQRSAKWEGEIFFEEQILQDFEFDKNDSEIKPSKWPDHTGT